MARKNPKPSAAFSEAVAQELRRVKEQKSNWLRLDNSGLTELPEAVYHLPQVEHLNLAYNKLTQIPQKLLALPNLRTVIVAGNPIESLPRFPGFSIDVPIYRRLRKQFGSEPLEMIVDLTASDTDVDYILRDRDSPITTLIIGQMGLQIGHEPRQPSSALRKLISSLRLLNRLQYLLIRGIAIGVVPERIGDIQSLKTLSLDSLNLTVLPDWIGDLNLERFSAVDNHLTSIPDSFRKLGRLKSMTLHWNPLHQIPQAVFDLTSLEYLGVRDCKLVEIPAEILRLNHLTRFHCSQNPIQSPPTEVARKGLISIRDYWRQRADVGVDYLCEAKLIILGEPGAGKTSLARKIENPTYSLSRNEPSTEGIDVIRYKFPTTIHTKENNQERILQREFEVNIWDFGGQEIYHATHQFFLTRRSVYVLVCDDRKEDTDFSYWLHVVEMLSDASPLLIVQNEKQDRSRDINLSNLRARFANLREAIPTNLETNRGLDRVVQSIRKELERLPHVGVGLPATWKRVREAMESDPRDYISLDEFFDLCHGRGFKLRNDKLQLSGYLHDLGVCLHFQDDPTLKNTVVLKPSWGTDAVYRVLDDAEVIKARGRFAREQLARIWSEKKYEGMHDELLRLMMKFQLCYALDDQDAYIAPQLLSSEQPSYSWDSRDTLVVRYEYDFLPKGIVTRFIVAMHRLISSGTLVWKTGVVLRRDGSRAEVIEEYSNKRIRVRVSGANALGLLSIVDDQLSRLHASFPLLKCQRYLPCPCAECREKTEPYGFALSHLMNMVARGTEIQCHISGLMVDAAELVRNVFPGALRQESYDVATSKESTTDCLTLASPDPEVFVSYAWNDETCKIVDHLQNTLEQHGIQLLRDREEIRYKNSIRDFMKRLGRGKCVVAVISDKYLKSESCMFELVEVAKSQQLRERIFPIVLPDANIYKATGRVKYVKHWESEIKDLDEALKAVRQDNLKNLQEDLNIYTEIRRLFDDITGTLRDMNALSPDQHTDSDFDTLIQRIRAQLDA